MFQCHLSDRERDYNWWRQWVLSRSLRPGGKKKGGAKEGNNRGRKGVSKRTQVIGLGVE